MKAIGLLSVLFALLLCGCVAHVDADSLIRPTPGTRLATDVVPAGAWRVSDHDITIDDATQLYAALFHRPKARALLIYFGGNQFTISQYYAKVLEVYEPYPVDLLIVDHRGYGASSGSGSINALLDDAVRIYDFARALPRYAGTPVIVHGQSLGSFMAGEVARLRQLDGLVLESSATTAEDWIQGFVDSSLLVRRGVVEGELQGKGNLPVMGGLDEPLLVVVGENDKSTPAELSQALYDAAALSEAEKELLIVPGAGHNDATLHASYGSAFARLLAKAVRAGDKAKAP